jgi:hypothetical protein
MLWGVPIWIWVCFAVSMIGPVTIHLLWSLLFDKYLWNEAKVKEAMGEDFVRRHNIG